MWAVIAAVVLALTTVFDYRWLRSFAWPLYLINIGLLVLTLRIGTGTGEAGNARSLGRRSAASSSSSASLPRSSWSSSSPRTWPIARQSVKSPWTIIGAIVIMVPPWVLVMLQPDLGHVSRARRHRRRHALHVRSEPVLARHAGRRASSAADPDRLGRPARLPAGPPPDAASTRAPIPRAPASRCIQAETAVNAGRPGRQGPDQRHGRCCRSQTTDFVWGVLAEELGFIGAMVVLDPVRAA